MNDHQTTAESLGTIAAKAAPPVSVSIAQVAGYQVSEILMWATLLYTFLMIGHKLIAIWDGFNNRACKCQ